MKAEQKIIRIETLIFVGITAFLLLMVLWAQAQRPGRRDLGPSTLGVEKGIAHYETDNWEIDLLHSSQTVAGLKAKGQPGLDYTPGNRLAERDKNRFYHLGDLNLGIREAESGEWTFYSTAADRKDVIVLDPDDADVFAVADLSPSLPADIPVSLIRKWKKEGDQLLMQFELINQTDRVLEIGALGMPLVFNNNFNRKTLDEAHAGHAFFDPYIGKDAGYLQVVQLNGKSKVLLVVPDGETPFENYRPLSDDPTPIGYTFEGLHEWMVHSKAYAETEWKGVEQWNEPTSAFLQPGQSKMYGLRFLLADSLRDVENTLIRARRPVAVGIPGYVLPMDVQAKLFLRYSHKIKSWNVEPDGALLLSEGEETPGGWFSYEVQGKKWGRARLTVGYGDGTSQTIHYKVIEPEKEVIESYGHFLTTEQWYDDTTDIFGRAPSVITYDYEKKEKVLQDARAWIAGLSDEGGAGSWLGAIMKQVVLPDKEEVAKLEDFVNQTLWGGIQYAEGEKKYAVRKSLFYYEPDSMPPGTYSDEIRWGRYGGFPSWSK
ncbi:MAG TPA: DUF5695 domain-containing protein, partial [Prolixibacteraceae bacterium]|nr:DUF5695 domain-containing protein [Prolixibacteraceae bacterium]